MRIALYDDQDVDRLARHLREQSTRRGRPRLWTDDERRRRRNAHSRSGYHRRRRAAQLADCGRLADAATEFERAERLAGDIQSQARERADLVRRDRP